ncbi:hypothetical protein HK098_002894 [Nowakowskiella sp. JEL0407]|nr:hypothetical protein HK098_002894 [Nowakowskiella sp. JEL0407]
MNRLLSSLFVIIFYVFYVNGQATSDCTDAATGISGGCLQLGNFAVMVAIPSDTTTYPNEFIVKITGSRTNGAGWSGLALGGSMLTSLLLVASIDNGATSVSTSLRVAPYYAAPVLYTGSATLTKLAQTYNSTHFTVTVRCKGCTSFSQEGVSNTIDFTQASGVWGYGMASTSVPADPTQMLQHDLGFGMYGVQYSNIKARGANYGTWIKLGQASTTTTTTRTSPRTTTTTTTRTSASPASSSPTGVAAKTYDYIIVGGGAGGQVMADKLSESGKSQVLLIERGPPSTWVNGGRDGSAWITDNQLTRFDVPGLCNEIWNNASTFLCNDYDAMAGCLLGGGTAINAGMFWKPPKQDWDNNFPSGWKSSDMAQAVANVFTKIPSTTHPSMDGQNYLTQVYDLLSPTLASSGWTNVPDPNANPDLKNRTFYRPPTMFINGQRGGPLATYMVNARSRTNFAILFDTMGLRAVRTGSKITGVDVQATGGRGFTGTIYLNPNGRVISSAGTFGSAKFLWRSGIGSTDMLNVVAASSDAGKMVPSSQWINLPVGYNLMDHTNTDLEFSHPNVVQYDFHGAYSNPVASDKSAYLNGRTGILAIAAPGFPISAHEIITASDGKTRSFQWQISPRGTTSTSVIMSLYLGNGYTSRGRLVITSSLNTQVQTKPYAANSADTGAIISAVKNMYSTLAKISNLKWISPATGLSASQIESFVNNYNGGRGSNHWMGSCKMGTDDGRSGGTSVVDTNTKVYGTDNLFVVDASIFPGMVTGNPTAAILSAAEQAAMKILALGSSTSSTTTSASPKTTTTTTTAVRSPTTTSVRVSPTTTTVRTSASPSPSPVAGNCVAKYGQCGGLSYTGSTICCSGSTCKYSNDWYSQCL